MANKRNIHFHYQRNEALTDQLETLFSKAEENKFNIVKDHKEANIIVSIGGDGDFLQTVRNTGFRQDALYTGMTRPNESGLYCDFSLDRIDEMFTAIQNEGMEMRHFPLISAEVNGQSAFYCLNEVSLRSTIIKSIVIDVFIDDLHFETFRGDGLIIATPTGSTGYNKSTHGAVIDPMIPSIQVSEIAALTNNKFRTLGSSFVLGPDRELRLEVIQDGNDHPIIGLDNEAYSIRNIKDIVITLSDKQIKTVKLKSNSYWQRVKDAFL